MLCLPILILRKHYKRNWMKSAETRKGTISLSNAIQEFGRPQFSAIIKPLGSKCNMKCAYCYYLEKAGLYHGIEPLMSDETLELFTEQFIEDNTADELSICWHGGEPLLLGLDFFSKALEYQKKYADSRAIVNSIQTNGILLDEQWCQFFADNKFLVGISLDGPQDVHDKYRQNKVGNSSFKKTVDAIKLLKKYNVEFNTLSVINKGSEGQGCKIYRFLRDEIGSRYMQFLPAADKDMPWAISAEGFGQFLIDVFDEWSRNDIGKIFVLTFDATLAGWCGITPGLCAFNDICCDSLTVEHNGDIYACDHFVDKKYLLGNIKGKRLGELFTSSDRIDFVLGKKNNLPEGCMKCNFLSLCNGGCPEHRRNGRNVLCDGFRMYFKHTAELMKEMRDYILANR